MAVGPFDKCAALSLTTTKVGEGRCGICFLPLSAEEKNHTRTLTHTEQAQREEEEGHLGHLHLFPAISPLLPLPTLPTEAAGAPRYVTPC